MSLLPALLVSLIVATCAQWTAVPHRSNEDNPKREVAMSQDASRIILRSQDEGYYLMQDTDSSWSNSPVTVTPPGLAPIRVDSFETTFAMSADGSKVLVLGEVDLWLSSDGGVTWAKLESQSLSDLSIEAERVTMSPDGSKILICGDSSGSSGLAVSHDAGSTWTELAWLDPSNAPYFQPLDCSMSADGQTIAVIAHGREVMVSTDGGSTFSQSTSGSSTNRIWKKILVSNDGSKILVGNSPLLLETDTSGYISFDSGATWTRPTGVSPWIDMAMSDDGSTIYVLADMECSGGGYQCELPSTKIWSSLDGGSTWQQESVFSGDRGWWSDIEVSSDGSMVVAIEMGTFMGGWNTVFHKGWPTSTITSTMTGTTTGTTRSTTFTSVDATATTVEATPTTVDATTTTTEDPTTVVEVTLTLAVDDPADIIENATLTDAMIEGFADVMGIDVNLVTLRFEVARRLQARKLQVQLMAIFEVTLPSAGAARETREAVEAISVEATNSAITSAVVAQGFQGSMEVTGKEARTVEKVGDGSGASSSVAISPRLISLMSLLLLVPWC